MTTVDASPISVIEKKMQFHVISKKYSLSVNLKVIEQIKYKIKSLN